MLTLSQFRRWKDRRKHAALGRPAAVALLRLAVIALVGVACSSAASDWRSKIGFDLEGIDAQGLIGQPDGLRAQSYEFCIPLEREPEVVAIDATIGRCQRSPGRVGCNQSQALCIGHTHQRDYLQVLERLGSLDYVEQIEPAWFE